MHPGFPFWIFLVWGWGAGRLPSPGPKDKTQHKLTEPPPLTSIAELALTANKRTHKQTILQMKHKQPRIHKQAKQTNEQASKQSIKHASKLSKQAKQASKPSSHAHMQENQTKPIRTKPTTPATKPYNGPPIFVSMDNSLRN